MRPFLTLTLFLATLAFFLVLYPLVAIFLDLTGEKIWLTLKDVEVWQSLRVSFAAATCAALLGAVLGVPVSYLLARGHLPRREIFESLLNIPIVIPHVAVGILLLNVLNHNAFLGRLFAPLGIHFVDTFWGLVAAMCFVSFSYVVSAALMGFSAVSEDLELAARTLGASPWYVFRKVTGPLIFPYLMRGFILAVARGVSEMGAILILAYYPKTASILLYERFENYGLSQVEAITALIVCVSLFLFAILTYFTRRAGEHA